MLLSQKVASLLLLSICIPLRAEESWHPSWPAPLENRSWLSTHSRLCFDVTEKNLEEVLKDGTNVICGGTNAAGIGFAGAPQGRRSESKDRGAAAKGDDDELEMDCAEVEHGPLAERGQRRSFGPMNGPNYALIHP